MKQEIKVTLEDKELKLLFGKIKKNFNQDAVATMIQFDVVDIKIEGFTFDINYWAERYQRGEFDYQYDIYAVIKAFNDGDEIELEYNEDKFNKMLETLSFVEEI